MSRAARKMWRAGCALGCLGACLSERSRPGPPLVTIVLDKTTVYSPDTLTGTVRAEDASGIDSIWLSVDVTTIGEDGLLKTVFQAPFRSPIAKNYTAGRRIPVQFRARDFEGFVGQLDTAVSVIP